MNLAWETSKGNVIETLKVDEFKNVVVDNVPIRKVS